MLSCTGKRSHRHTILHVSFSNSFGLASARPTPQGLSGAPGEPVFDGEEEHHAHEAHECKGDDVDAEQVGQHLTELFHCCGCFLKGV